MQFKDRLRALREEAGMSQPQLADKIGVTNGAVGNWETGDRYPRKAAVEALADVFGVTVDYLMCRDDTRPEFTAAELDLIRLFRFASDDDKQIIQLILKKYETGVVE